MQSFSSASVILNLSELPGPGGFPPTFRLSVVPRPWSTMVSITVRLFLNRNMQIHKRRAAALASVERPLTVGVTLLPDYEERGDAVVLDGSEPHTQGLDFSGLQEEVEHKRSGGAFHKPRAALYQRRLPTVTQQHYFTNPVKEGFETGIKEHSPDFCEPGTPGCLYQC